MPATTSAAAQPGITSERASTAEVSSTPIMNSTTIAAPARRPLPLPRALSFSVTSVLTSSISRWTRSVTIVGMSPSNAKSDRLVPVGPGVAPSVMTVPIRTSQLRTTRPTNPSSASLLCWRKATSWTRTSRRRPSRRSFVRRARRGLLGAGHLSGDLLGAVGDEVHDLRCLVLDVGADCVDLSLHARVVPEAADSGLDLLVSLATCASSQYVPEAEAGQEEDLALHASLRSMAARVCQPIPVGLHSANGMCGA